MPVIYNEWSEKKQGNRTPTFSVWLVKMTLRWETGETDSRKLGKEWGLSCCNILGKLRCRFGLERASLVAQMVKNLPSVLETQVPSLGREDPRRRAWQPTPVFLPGGSRGRSSLAGHSDPWGCRVRHDWVTNTFSLGEEIRIWVLDEIA